jgi:hypothetical protein
VKSVLRLRRYPPKPTELGVLAAKRWQSFNTAAGTSDAVRGAMKIVEINELTTVTGGLSGMFSRGGYARGPRIDARLHIGSTEMNLHGRDSNVLRTPNRLPGRMRW